MVLAACGLASCARLGTGRAAPGRRAFAIGLRGAPPAMPQPYAQAAQAGFNVIVDSVGPDALDLAQQYGLKLMVSRIGLHTGAALTEESRRRAVSAISRFRGHPALWGYFLGDGARERDFGDTARLIQFLRDHDSAHPFYLELLSCDAWVGPGLLTADYESYLDRCVQALGLPVLVFAHYPFREKGESPFYFENLELVRRAALARGLPFWQTVRGALWQGMGPLGEGQLRWLAYTSLAYGASGIVWNGYWGSPDGGPQGIVEPDGTPTARYRWIAEINRELRVLGPVLVGLRSTAVYHTGGVPAGATRLPVHGLVGALEGGAYVVGLFEDGEGRAYLLVVNKDTGREVAAKLTINHPGQALWWLDPARGDWQEMEARDDRTETAADFPLPPGGGRLIRLGGPR